MIEPIGIDTHGYDQPPDNRVSPEEEARLEDIEEKLWELLDEWYRISIDDPAVPGYRIWRRWGRAV